MTIYVLLRIIEGPGGSMSFPVKAFQSEEDAKQLCENRDRFLRGLIERKLDDSEVPVREMLADMGIVRISHHVVEMPVVEDSLITVPKLVIS